MPNPSVDSLIQTIQNKDPNLYSILSSMYDDFTSLYDQVNPPAASTRIVSNPTVIPDDVANFIYALNSENVSLSWDAVTTAASYTVRRGSVWATASYVTNVTARQIFLNPLLVGDTTFLIKAINGNGQESANATSVTVTVPGILGPVVTGSGVLNTAILTWAAPVSAFRINYYIVTRNGVVLTQVGGTFFAYTESSAGTYTYGISAVDIAGNVGTESTASITVTAPVDYIVQSTQTSSFTGTLTNAFLDTFRTVLEVCLDVVETYGDHFLTRGYASPQDQINAGFPYYGEPAQATAQYQEVFDFGILFNNVVAGLSWLYQVVDGAVGIATTLEFSVDNIIWTAPVAGPTAFASAVRYVRATVDFTGGNADLLEFSVFQCALAVHRENDGGSGTANAGDVGGTVFTFNKTFVAVESVTCTALATANYTCVVNSISTTQFSVEVFDTLGIRVTTTIEWKARGII